MLVAMSRGSALRRLRSCSIFACIRLLLIVWYALLSLSLPHGAAAAAIQDDRGTVSGVIKASLDSVVLIMTSDASGKQLSQGSGFIVSADGEILTNYHVIEGAHSGVVKLTNGAFFMIDGIVGANKGDDLALLKVAGKDLHPLALGRADALSVGDRVIAIGSPLGLQNTVSDGIVSAIREASSKRSWIQVTAPVSPGNSGGPLLTLDGKVIGIITWRVSSGENLNFAMPIDAAKPLMASLRNVAPLDGGAGQPESAQSHNPAGVTVWTSMTTGHDYKVRTEGEYIYTDWMNLPAALRDTPAFVRSEFRRSGDKWVGKGRGYMPGQFKGRTHWCSLEWETEITSLSDTRIEGRSHALVDVDARTCQPKKLEWKPFTWIPKQ